MPKAPPIVLTIAGFDPSSGAGVTADIKAIAAHGCYGVACITALTVQSTMGVRRVQPVQAEMVGETLVELSRDVAFSAVHIGMLGSGDVASAVAAFLAKHRPPNVVLDPIVASTSGANLIDQECLNILRDELMLLATVVTPNLKEASDITGLRVEDRQQMGLAAEKMLQMGAKAVIVTGGHLAEPADLLSFEGKHGVEQQFFEATHIESKSTHGTGCAFSATIACQLAQGESLPAAVVEAQEYVRLAILNAYPIGGGAGPINHLFDIKKNNAGT